MSHPVSLVAVAIAVAVLPTVGCNMEPIAGVDPEAGFEVDGTDSDIAVITSNVSAESAAYAACPSCGGRSTDDAYERVEDLEMCVVTAE